MGRIFAGARFEDVVERLADEIAQQQAGGDLFEPTWVVASTSTTRQWLELHLARQHGICVNIRFEYLEGALWTMLQRLGPPDAVPERLTVAHLRAMILGILTTDPGAPDLAPLAQYLGDADIPRLYHRKARQLSDRLARLFEEYEFHRAAMLANWKAGTLPGATEMERAQRALYLRLLQPGGLRDRLAQQDASRRLTLGEYAREVFAHAPPIPPGKPIVHIFGLSHVSPLHASLLHQLANGYDLRIYLITPLAARTPLTRDTMAQACDADPAENDPLALWGLSATRSLRRLRILLMDPAAFDFEAVPTTPAPCPKSLLRTLQDHLISGTIPARPEADESLQILACPSAYREVETAAQLIIRDLKSDPDLKPSDIALLVPDMGAYRAPIQSIFTRDGVTIPFILREVSICDDSHYARAVIDLLELIEGRFARQDVCRLLTNPSFLAAAGATREDANQWIDWICKLNIFHSFDASAKKEGNYFATPAFTWHRGLARLRLGRIFGQDEEDEALAGAFDDLTPFSDLESGDADLVGRFCGLIERLWRRLVPLAKLARDAAGWRQKLGELFDDFLSLPEPDDSDPQTIRAEGAVRRRVFDALAGLDELDAICHALEKPPEFKLAPVRQHLLDELRGISGSFGRMQPGGVVIAETPSARPLAFKIVHVLGLGEGDFPGSEVASALDLARLHRADTDIESPDLNRGLFLDAILSARHMLRLSYVCRDLQRDREMYPSSVLNELSRRLNEQFQIPVKAIRVPLSATDPSYLADGPLVNFCLHDRLACLIDLQTRGQIALDGELITRERSLRQNFSPPPIVTPEGAATPVQQIQLRQLKKFLQDPAEAAALRHLRLIEDDSERPETDEPFYSVFPNDWQCKDAVLRRFAARALRENPDAAIENLENDFNRYFAGCQRIGEAPEGAFGQVDRRRLFADVNKTARAIHRYISARSGCNCTPGIVIGSTRGGDRDWGRFPPLALTVGDIPVQLSGAGAFLFRGDDFVEMLVITAKSNIGGPIHNILEPFLFMLALRAGTDANEHGAPSGDWVGDRAFRLIAASQGGIVQFKYPAIASDEAHDYLALLCRDYLDQQSFDLLPFDTVISFWNTPQNDFAQALRTQVMLDQEQQSRDGEGDLLRLMAPEVPENAWEIVQRRLSRFYTEPEEWTP